MMAPEDAKATIEQVLQSTGRDGAVDLVVKMHAFGVLPHSAAARELYCSSNGDRWYLVRDADRAERRRLQERFRRRRDSHGFERLIGAICRRYTVLNEQPEVIQRSLR